METLADTRHGPGWVIWVVFGVFAVISAVLLSGRGSGLISGYNTAPPEEKARYDEKKLCRITGAGMAVITLVILIAGIFENSLPASFSYVILGVILASVAAILVLSNTVCRRK